MALVSAFACTLVLGGVTGCIIDNRAPPDTEIEFEETANIGSCGDASQFAWTVANRQTGEQGTASCAQPVLFRGLAANTTYTFDVTGTLGSRVCWQGWCNVDTRYGARTYADCSGQIAHLCGF
jgi:hypothetical protein